MFVYLWYECSFRASNLSIEDMDTIECDSLISYVERIALDEVQRNEKSLNPGVTWLC
jgi:hypothetical protein